LSGGGEVKALLVLRNEATNVLERAVGFSFFQWHTTSGYTHLSHKYPLYLFNIFFGKPTMAFGVSDIN